MIDGGAAGFVTFVGWTIRATGAVGDVITIFEGPEALGGGILGTLPRVETAFDGRPKDGLSRAVPP